MNGLEIGGIIAAFVLANIAGVVLAVRGRNWWRFLILYALDVAAVTSVSAAIILSSPYLEEGWQGRETFWWYHVDEAQAGLIYGGFLWLLGLAMAALVGFVASKVPGCETSDDGTMQGDA